MESGQLLSPSREPVEILEAVTDAGWDDIRLLDWRNGFRKPEETRTYNSQLSPARSRRGRAVEQPGFID